MSGAFVKKEPAEIEDNFETPVCDNFITMEGASAMLKSKGYTGEDPDTFLRGFARIAKANKWDEERQLAILPALFSETHEWLARELEEDTKPTCIQIHV